MAALTHVHSDVQRLSEEIPAAPGTRLSWAVHKQVGAWSTVMAPALCHVESHWHVGLPEMCLLACSKLFVERRWVVCFFRYGICI